MEVGDVDMDGIDELAMTVNVNDLKETSYDGHTELEKSYLTVYDYNDKSSWTQKLNKKLLNSNDGASGRARFAGVTIGYVSDAPSGSIDVYKRQVPQPCHVPDHRRARSCDRIRRPCAG